MDNQFFGKVKQFAAAITAISVICSSMYIVQQFYMSTQAMQSVVQQNTVAIKSLETSIKDVPTKMMTEHDAGVLFSTLNFPNPTPADKVAPKIDEWFAKSWGIQIQAMIHLCKYDKKLLSSIIYKQNVRKYCPRFGTFALIERVMHDNEEQLAND